MRELTDIAVANFQAQGVQNVFLIFFIAQKVSNIHLVTKDFKIVPLTNLLKLLLAGRVVGGEVCLVRFILMQQ